MLIAFRRILVPNVDSYISSYELGDGYINLRSLEKVLRADFRVRVADLVSSSKGIELRDFAWRLHTPD